MTEIKINTEYITLGQLLKFANIISNGSYAKIYLLNHLVLVNGENESRRGRKIYPEYIVEVEKYKIKVIK